MCENLPGLEPCTFVGLTGADRVVSAVLRPCVEEEMRVHGICCVAIMHMAIEMEKIGTFAE